jgi:oligoribonuclease (3'-5' exoribonuclease)
MNQYAMRKKANLGLVTRVEQRKIPLQRALIDNLVIAFLIVWLPEQNVSLRYTSTSAPV